MFMRNSKGCYLLSKLERKMVYQFLTYISQIVFLFHAVFIGGFGSLGGRQQGGQQGANGQAEGVGRMAHGGHFSRRAGGQAGISGLTTQAWRGSQNPA
jgi:hypothetical protein